MELVSQASRIFPRRMRVREGGGEKYGWLARLLWNSRPRASVLDDCDETATELALGRTNQLQPGAS